MGENSEGSFSGIKMLEGQNQPKIVQKRIKCQEIAEEGQNDRISALPDCLLLEILSRLHSTKGAIRTGSLSKRWTHLWTWVPTLHFEFIDLPRTQSLYSDYALLVDKTLAQCRQMKLKKFEVYTFYDIRYESLFNNWIHYAISCNIEELNLSFWYMGRKEAEFMFWLDQFLFFNSSCLTNMSLMGCMLNPPGPICWKNLRRLCISYLNLTQDLIVNILSGSPLLETLELEYCYGYDWDYGTLDTINSDDDEEIEINFPNSLSLTQCPQLKLKKFNVYTRFHIEFEAQLNTWIRYAIRCNVKELNLQFSNSGFGDEFMMLDQILFTSSCITELRLDGCMVNLVGAISWKNLRSLCISDSSYENIDEDLIDNILSGSPVLETLMLDNCYGYRQLNITSKSVKNFVFSQYWNPYDKIESDSEDIIEITAPHILSLTIQQNIFLQKLLLLNVSSLVKADLNYTCTKTMHRRTYETEEEMLKGLIMNLGHVKELKLGFLCSKEKTFFSFYVLVSH